MFDRFSEDARKVMSNARRAALDFGHDFIGTEHLLLGVLAIESSVATAVLTSLGADAGRVRAAVELRMTRGTQTATLSQLPFTPAVKRVLEESLEEALGAGHDHIGTGHLLLGLLHHRDGLAAKALGDAGVNYESARPKALDVLRTRSDPRDGPPPGTSTMVGGSSKSLFVRAYGEAERLRAKSVEEEHVLLAMLRGDGVAARVLRQAGVTAEGVERAIRDARGG